LDDHIKYVTMDEGITSGVEVDGAIEMVVRFVDAVATTHHNDIGAVDGGVGFEVNIDWE
jgi:hypothetical protein